MEKKEIVKSTTKYEIVKPIKTHDLLKAEPIISHKDYKLAYQTVFISVQKAFESLAVQYTSEQIKTLTDDLIDRYKYEAIEDIQYCLKKGRQGVYGNNYGKLNMIIISEWMANVLDEKALAREKELSKLKTKGIKPLEIVDYDAYKKRIKKPKEKNTNKKENDYQKFRLNYYDNRPNETD